MVLFALKYDKEYQEDIMNKIRMNEFELVEDENNEGSQEETFEENKELIEEKEEEHEEHEEITGG